MMMKWYRNPPLSSVSKLSTTSTKLCTSISRLVYSFTSLTVVSMTVSPSSTRPPWMLPLFLPGSEPRLTRSILPLCIMTAPTPTMGWAAYSRLKWSPWLYLCGGPGAIRTPDQQVSQYAVYEPVALTELSYGPPLNFLLLCRGVVELSFSSWF